MAQAREIMDSLTKAVLAEDWDTVRSLYAEDAVVVAPDAGEVRGREGIVAYFAQQAVGFPDAGYEVIAKHETGDVAVDEGYFTGTNTGDLALPSGESLPATGKSLRVRAADIVHVEGGVVTSHHFYWDQVELLGQLGLMPDMPS